MNLTGYINYSDLDFLLVIFSGEGIDLLLCTPKASNNDHVGTLKVYNINRLLSRFYSAV